MELHMRTEHQDEWVVFITGEGLDQARFLQNAPEGEPHLFAPMSSQTKWFTDEAEARAVVDSLKGAEQLRLLAADTIRMQKVTTVSTMQLRGVVEDGRWISPTDVEPKG